MRDVRQRCDGKEESKRFELRPFALEARRIDKAEIEVTADSGAAFLDGPPLLHFLKLGFGQLNTLSLSQTTFSS